MKQYQIIRERDGVKEVIETSTRKRDIEKSFNSLMRSFRKENRYVVIPKNISYSIVVFCGEYGGLFETEYYIIAA